MKNWIAILLALVMALSLCACSKNVPVDQEDNKNVTVSLLTDILAVRTEANGTIVNTKVVMEYDDDYNIIGIKTYEDDELVLESVYDKIPDKPLVQQYYENGKKASRTECTYDSNGNTLTQYSYNAAGEIEWGYVYAYDADGNRLSEKCYDLDGLASEFTCTYDQNGNLLTATTTWPTNSDALRTVYTYNEQGDKLTEIRYVNDREMEHLSYEHIYTDGKLTTTYHGDQRIGVTQYDSDGNMVLECSYSGNNELYRTEYTYKNGNLVKQVSFSQGEETSSLQCTFNSDGKLTERIAYREGAVDNRLTCTYDESGNAVRIQSTNDAMGNVDCTLNYRSVAVSAEIAKRIEQMNASLDIF